MLLFFLQTPQLLDVNPKKLLKNMFMSLERLVRL